MIMERTLVDIWRNGGWLGIAHVVEPCTPTQKHFERTKRWRNKDSVGIPELPETLPGRAFTLVSHPPSRRQWGGCPFRADLSPTPKQKLKYILQNTYYTIIENFWPWGQMCRLPVHYDTARNRDIASWNYERHLERYLLDWPYRASKLN